MQNETTEVHLGDVIGDPRFPTLAKVFAAVTEDQKRNLAESIELTRHCGGELVYDTATGKFMLRPSCEGSSENPVTLPVTDMLQFFAERYTEEFTPKYLDSLQAITSSRSLVKLAATPMFLADTDKKKPFSPTVSPHCSRWAVRSVAAQARVCFCSGS